MTSERSTDEDDDSERTPTQPDRSKFLTQELRVSPSEVRWRFISDYYDAPIAGLVFFRNRICRCCCFGEDVPHHHVYVIHELSPTELAEELRRATKFERMVGTHWSGDELGRPLPDSEATPESRERYYQEERYIGVDALDRPIIAWFDALADDANG